MAAQGGLPARTTDSSMEITANRYRSCNPQSFEAFEQILGQCRGWTEELFRSGDVDYTKKSMVAASVFDPWRKRSCTFENGTLCRCLFCLRTLQDRH